MHFRPASSSFTASEIPTKGLLMLGKTMKYQYMEFALSAWPFNVYVTGENYAPKPLNILLHTSS